MATFDSLVTNVKHIFTKKKVISYNTELMNVSNTGSQPYGSSVVNTAVGKVLINNYQNLGNYILQTPEIMSIIHAYVTDILSDGYHFESISGKDKAESNIRRATLFCETQQLDEVLYKVLFEKLVYGNGFLVVNAITESQIGETVESLAKELGIKSRAGKKALYYRGKEIIDEVAYRNVKLQHLPSKTVTIKVSDKYANHIIYKQKVDLDEVVFKDTEVIHFRDIELDGKVWGNSRLVSLKSEITMLWAIKNYIGAFFDNNGTPNYAFIMEGTNPNSEAAKALKAQLQEIKVNKKQSNILIYNKAVIQKLNDFTKDMEFGNLIKYLTSLFAMTYQMPPSRYGAADGGNAEGTTLTNQGYYRQISSDQDGVEKILNSQIFIPFFNVKLKFNRSYKEDETREVTNLKTKYDIITQAKGLGLMTREMAARMLNVPVSELPEEEEWKVSTPGNKQEQDNSRFNQQIVNKTGMLDDAKKKENLKNTPNKFEGTKSDPQNKK
jgi:hypothetical protein